MREYEEGYPVDANDRYYQGEHPDPERKNSSNFGFANVKRNAVPGGNKVREDATDYLNERLKVMPYESTEVLFDQRVEIDAESGNIMQYALPISDGDSVKVTWNGTEYECTAGLAEGSGGTIFFGNPGFIGGTPNDLPFGFAIGTFDGDAMLMIIAPDYGGQSVSIKIEGNVIHTIDPKFLPGGGGGGRFTVALTFTENNEPMVDKTFEEIASVIESGQDVLLAQNTEGYAGFYRLNMYVGGMFVKFSNVFIDGLTTTVLTCTINDNGTVNFSEQTISASGSGGGPT